MKNRFDLIIFDWDGTLVNSIDWIVQCIQQAAAQCNCPVPTAEAVKDIIGLSIENAMRTLFPDLPDDSKSNISKQYSQIFFSRPISRDDLFPGIYELLLQLRQQGYLLAVATGKKSSGLAQAMQATDLAQFFSTTRSVDQAASKPDPLMIEQIVTELGVHKSRTLMVGDSVHDLQMALNAQIASVAVTCGAHSETVLKQFNPLACLSQSTDLMRLL